MEEALKKLDLLLSQVEKPAARRRWEPYEPPQEDFELYDELMRRFPDKERKVVEQHIRGVADAKDMQPATVLRALLDKIAATLKIATCFVLRKIEQLGSLLLYLRQIPLPA
ncbi:hypothetical protein COU20_02705 [Candidatus Kaiserbacteria bacterium CG10_big_fil_rev_8_21_14_0_10_59_10]|uniref:Uncharacterized protein n=1 Tax=Candidatus Kaiserbacteria bacterium CG10_big_fil_rev_8_21_14_0_10_59_10 TaxID=1974612 RepID=A0A2H0U7M6_9BACT|nr:MAG: hypothetical protein COU20_02705 [Candidatus Kaiserbacteria bacterium CG10_big_fil_rev_8_21_14_0_10_59_10]